MESADVENRHRASLMLNSDIGSKFPLLNSKFDIFLPKEVSSLEDIVGMRLQNARVRVVGGDI